MGPYFPRGAGPISISNQLLDDLLKGYKLPKDLIGDAGLRKERKIRLMVRLLGAELAGHLGCEAGVELRVEQNNSRTGVATKWVKGSDGEMLLTVPRDRDGSIEAKL